MNFIVSHTGRFKTIHGVVLSLMWLTTLNYGQCLHDYLPPSAAGSCLEVAVRNRQSQMIEGWHWGSRIGHYCCDYLAFCKIMSIFGLWIWNRCAPAMFRDNHHGHDHHWWSLTIQKCMRALRCCEVVIMSFIRLGYDRVTLLLSIFCRFSSQFRYEISENTEMESNRRERLSR